MLLWKVRAFNVGAQSVADSEIKQDGLYDAFIRMWGRHYTEIAFYTLSSDLSELRYVKRLFRKCRTFVTPYRILVVDRQFEAHK